MPGCQAMLRACLGHPRTRSSSLQKNVLPSRPEPGNIRCRIEMCSEPRSYSWQPRACVTTRSPNASTLVATWSASGASASSSNAWPALKNCPAPVGPTFFPPDLVVEVKAIACQMPAELGLPLARLQIADIRSEVLRRGLVAEISGSTIWRWLDEDALRPWTFRSWIFPRDPDFEAKAGQVLDLYARKFAGRRLGPLEFVISADEKTSIQARRRCCPSLPPAPRRALRVEHEYERCGSLQYMVAWDVHRARLFSRCEPKTGITPFGRLIDQVMLVEPYRSADRVFWVVDNGSSHRGKASVERWQLRHPNLRLVHCPIHSSWLNQVEIYLSIVDRKVLTPNDFHDLDQVEHRLLDFERRYEHAAKPFEWKFTRRDLANLLRRLQLRPAA